MQFDLLQEEKTPMGVDVRFFEPEISRSSEEREASEDRR